MVSTLVLLSFLTVATVTDVRWRKVYNWTTYPGILLALAANGVATWLGLEPESVRNEVWGLVGCSDSVAGFFACSFAMLVCYVFFPGGVGGGDVKLLALVGAFLGLMHGLEALLWTFVLSGALAVCVLVWQFGAWRLATRAAQLVIATVRLGTWVPWSDEERARLKTDLFLSPGALAAVLVVQYQLVAWF